jgi:hypothetical protein
MSQRRIIPSLQIRFIAADHDAAHPCRPRRLFEPVCALNVERDEPVEEKEREQLMVKSKGAEIAYSRQVRYYKWYQSRAVGSTNSMGSSQFSGH